MDEFRTGHLEVISGPMFSGKSEELIRRLKRVEISGKSFFLFKPALDDRYDVEHVTTHDQRKLKAHIIGNDRASLEQLEDRIPDDVEVIAFDEANFFEPFIVDLTKKWLSEGRRVIAAGLDTNYRGETFGPMGDLLAMADYSDKVKAICVKCKERPAVMTQRIVNGRPASRKEPEIVVGSADKYEARCRRCHELRD